MGGEGVRIILLVIYSVLLVGCAHCQPCSETLVVSEPISGGFSKASYTIEGSGDVVSYRRNDEPTNR